MAASVPKVPAYARSKLEQIARDQKFVDDTVRISLELGSKVGDGFIGQIVRARIQGDRVMADGKVAADQQLSLICKFPFDDPKQREQFNSMTLFEREIIIYREILPELEQLQLAHGLRKGDDDGFWNYPRCYWASFDKDRGESLLVMEDLLERQMVMKDKYNPIDFDHTLVLMVALGKMTACSFALKQQRPEAFEKIRKLDDLLSMIMSTEQTAPLALRNCKLAASVFTADHEKHLRDKFLSLQDCLWDKTCRHVSAELAEPFATLNHGDCWINNVMYSYDETSGAINDFVLLDWQMAKCSSPAFDFIAFIYLCGEVDLRRGKFPALLTAFHDSFSKTFKRLGGDPEKTLSLDDLKTQMTRFGVQVLAMGTFAMPILSKLPDEFFQHEDNRHREEFRAQFEKYETKMKELVADTEQFDDLK